MAQFASGNTLLCNDPYLNKWDGEYVCMDCWYKLDPFIDQVRILSEEEAECHTPCDEVPIDKSIGKLSQERGVSIKFLLDFTHKYGCWSWTSWDVIRRIIKPQTAFRRCRYVELSEMIENNYVGPAQSFISYAQAGKWGDLIAGIADHADPNRFVWLDIFAVRQWPSDHPDLDFASTIEHCSSFIIICSSLPMIENIEISDAVSRKIEKVSPEIRKQISFLRVWCLVKAHKAATTRLIVNEEEKEKKKSTTYKMPFIMKGGSHELITVIQEDGSTTTTVTFHVNYSMLFKLSLLVDVAQAEATVPSDKARILTEIQSTIGMESLNQVIRGTLLSAINLAKMERSSLIQSAACGDQTSIHEILSDPKMSIHAAALCGYLSLVQKLFENGADIHIQNKEGQTALMFAVLGGHTDIIQLLIEKGADIHIQNTRGQKLLLMVCTAGHAPVVQLLLQHGANVHERDNVDGTTGLMFAALAGHVEVIRVLLANGAKIHDRDKARQQSAIMYATRGGKSSSYSTTSVLSSSSTAETRIEKSIQVIQCLIQDGGATAEDLDHDGQNVLMLAASRGHMQPMKMLLDDYGFALKIHMKDKKGRSVFALTVWGGYMDIIQYLLALSSKEF
jgi:ankyrin repeat protein